MKLFWTDLESTGLIVDKCVILEVAIAEADFNDPFNYRHLFQGVVHLSSADAKKLDPFIIDMHTKNGLLADCATSATTLQQLESRLLDIVPIIENKDDKPILAG